MSPYGAFSGFPKGSGGDEGARTPDPLLAKQVLSQLSYTPGSDPYEKRRKAGHTRREKTLSFFPSIFRRRTYLSKITFSLERR